MHAERGGVYAAVFAARAATRPAPCAVFWVEASLGEGAAAAGRDTAGKTNRGERSGGGGAGALAFAVPAVRGLHAGVRGGVATPGACAAGVFSMSTKEHQVTLSRPARRAVSGSFGRAWEKPLRSPWLRGKSGVARRKRAALAPCVDYLRPTGRLIVAAAAASRPTQNA